MQLLLTKQANFNRLIRGISLDDIKETIDKGIKTSQNSNIISNRSGIIIVYNKSNNNVIIKNIASRWSVQTVKQD